MSLTPSAMLPLGTVAPGFSLPGIDGKTVSLDDFDGAKAYLIAFICVHCPYVKHIEDEFAALAVEYQKKGVVVVAINSNDPDYDPDDDLVGMKKQAAEHNFSFSYLVDETQEVARAYQAACTPDLYVFGEDKRLVYRGRFDETRPGSGQPSGTDLRAALEAILDGKPVLTDQNPSIGCNVKWKS
jgi:peroxiredoxin